MEGNGHKPESIIIAGGGTAGWMSACLLVKAWGQDDAAPPCKITLIEAADISPIGVGEGSTPYLREFFRKLNLNDDEWMPACNATYKCGIRFPNWSNDKNYGSYFHPFFSQLDLEPARDFFALCNRRRRGDTCEAHPDHFFLAATLAAQQRAPIAFDSENLKHDYAYHFDAGLLARFLKNYALQHGVTHLVDKIVEVNTDADGKVSRLTCERSGAQSAAFFFDCSGFKSLLMTETLDIPYRDYSAYLFNDRAVAVASPRKPNAGLPSETVSSAASAGWIWKIPLRERFGNGYVYSSRYLHQDQAEDELLQSLEQPVDRSDCRHLSMRLGRLEEHWRHNCVGVGLAQGFIEPLEATAIGLLQFTVDQFIQLYSRHGDSHTHRQAFNRTINTAFDGTRDYVSLHYLLNTRSDTQYWRDVREDTKLSPSLEFLIKTWDAGEDFDAAMAQEAQAQAYMRPSWYCIFSGMGRYPKASAISRICDADAKKAKALCKELSQNFRLHADLLS